MQREEGSSWEVESQRNTNRKPPVWKMEEGKNHSNLSHVTIHNNT